MMDGLSFLTIDEVIELLNLPKGFIYDHTRKGSRDPLPCYKFGKHLRFKEDELVKWIERHRKK